MKRITYGSDYGFALPSLLIASFVMMTVLVSAASAATTASKALDEQYYTQLAQEAAESGTAYALSCIKKMSNIAVWSDDSKVLRPDTDCAGNIIPSADQYVLRHGNIRTSFSVGVVDTVSTGRKFNVVATTELMRSSGGTAYQVYTKNVSYQSTATNLVASQSSSGYLIVCGIIDAETWCWGQNDSGQLGDGTVVNSNVPVRALRLAGGLAGKVDTDVAAGDGFACSVSSGEAYCWGRNDYGQLGIGSTTNSSTPVKVNQATGLSGKTVTQIVATEKAVCAIASGDVYCWGNGTKGELGIGVAGTRTSPVKVSNIGTTAPTSRPVTKIATTPNARHICAIASSRAYCWGGNDNGQLGDNTYYDKYTPTAVYTTGVLGTKTVTDVAVGGWIYGSEFAGHTCVVASGDVYCWGVNEEGQIGQNTTGSYAPGFGYRIPVAVTSNLPAGQMQRVATGYSTSCALALNTVWCWGINDYGQLGIGATGRRTVPTAVKVATPGLQGKTITDLEAGVNRACAVADARTYCWGRNDAGQIGDGTTIHRFEPTEASFLRSTIPAYVY